LIEAASKEDLQRREKEFGPDPQFPRGYAASNQAHGKTVDKITTLPLNAVTEASYDFANAPMPRGFDLRIYSVPPSKADAFRARWRDFAVRIYQRHGLHSIGYRISELKDGTATGNSYVWQEKA
jgi:hypothetical protein